MKLSLKFLILSFLIFGLFARSSEKKSSVSFIDQTYEKNISSDFYSTINIVTDLNGDNYPDIIFAGFYTKDLLVLLNQSGKGFKQLKVEGISLGGFDRLEIVQNLFDTEKMSAVLVRTGMPNGADGALEFYEITLKEDSVRFEPYLFQNPITGLDSLSDIVFLDQNRDGLLDIFAGRWYSRIGLPNGNDSQGLLLFRAFKNQEGQIQFKNVTQELNLAANPQTVATNSVQANTPSFELGACDINGDQSLELLAPAYGRRWNKMLTERNGRYIDIGLQTGYSGDSLGLRKPDGNGNSYAVLCTDLDNDGRLDLFQGEITHEWAGAESDLTAILWNQGINKPFLRDTQLPRPATFKNQGDLGSDSGDLDLDGLQDLVVGNTDYAPETNLLVWRQESKRKFTDISSAIGFTLANPQGVTLADFDLDGDLDLITSQSPMRMPEGFKPRPFYLENKLINDKASAIEHKNNWIEIKLVGDGNSVHETAIGSTVYYKAANGDVLTRFLLPHASRTSQKWDVLHFGLSNDQISPLDKEKGVISIQVHWTNKDVTTHFVELGKLNIVNKLQSK